MLAQRILTVILAAPVLIGLIICPYSFVFKSLVVMCLSFALWELLTIVGCSRLEKIIVGALGTAHSLALLFIFNNSQAIFWERVEGASVLLAVFAFYCFLSSKKIEEVGRHLVFSLVGILYIINFGSTVGLLRDFSHGVFWVFLLLGMTWLNDTFAYFAGHRFGRHRLAPLISPGKTWEGLVGGYLGSFVGFLIFWTLFTNPLTLRQGVLLTLLIGTFGPLGDLSESLIKRTYGVKDSGNLIPGHGGMLDRIDALLFTAPVMYFYVQWLGF